MSLIFFLELLVFFLLPLASPLAAAAPSLRSPAALAEPASLHARLTAPRSELVGFPLSSGRRRAVRADVRDLGAVIPARSALVVDRSSGEVLYQKEADLVQPIASLTKLMTALVFLDSAPDWDKRLTITPEDHRGGGVEYFLPGESVKLRDLFYAALVGSSNTAAAALSRESTSSSSEFAALMNAKARELRMFSAEFSEPTGLAEGNRASARDVARLSSAAFSSPEILRAVSSKSYSFTPLGGKKKRVVRSTDLLLDSMLNQSPYRIVGGKTGTLGEETGYHLALSIASAEKDRDLLVVVLGSSSNAGRFSDAKTLAVWAFDAYNWPTP